MIPKTIHYCWFSGDKFPPLIENCLDSWSRILQGYELKKWDVQNTDFNIPFTKKAFQEKKWAFLTDYIRLKILFEEGGIFLDTDVLLIKSFDNLLNYNSFWNFANNGMVEPVVIGAQKGNELIKKCKSIYEQYSERELKHYQYTEIPKVITPVFVKYGLRSYDNIDQVLDENNIVFTHKAFCSLPFEKADTNSYTEFITEKSYAVHLWNADWFDDEFRFFWNNRWEKGWKLVFNQLKKNPFQSPKYFKNLLYHFLRQLKLK